MLTTSMLTTILSAPPGAFNFSTWEIASACIGGWLVGRLAWAAIGMPLGELLGFPFGLAGVGLFLAGDAASHFSTHIGILAFGLELLLVTVAIVAFTPALSRAWSRIVSVPGRIVRRVVFHVMNFVVPSSLRGAIDRFCEPDRLARWMERHTANTREPLLRGDRLAAAKQQWPEERFRWLYRDIPADLRRPLSWDGRLPGGVPVTWLGWHHMTVPAIAAIVQDRVQRSVRKAAGLGIILSVLAFGITMSHGLHSNIAYPAWANDASLHASWPIIAWYIDATVTTALSSASSVVIAILAAAIMAPGLALFNVGHGMRSYLSRASAPLTAPTRDALVVFKHRGDIRTTEQESYARQVDIAMRNPDAPVINIGRATGIARARGSMKSPGVGTVLAMDTHSIRQHVMAFGGTGEGKTEHFLKPLARRIFGMKWGQPDENGNYQRIGGYVTDGKGVLYQDLLALPEIRSRDDVRILGTGEGHFGVNLVSGMTPLEVSNMFKTISTQVMGGENRDTFWTELASNAVFHAAQLAIGLEAIIPSVDVYLSNPSSISDEDAEWKSFRPSSLIGLGYLASSPDAMKRAMSRFYDRSRAAEAEMDELPDELADGARSIHGKLNSPEMITTYRYINESWLTMAPETQSSIVANITAVTGKFYGAAGLRDQFATGMLPFDGITDVNYALEGGVLGVAVGEAEWGMVGKVVTTWLKTRLYIAAQRRQIADPEAAKRQSVTVFIDEAQSMITAGDKNADAEFAAIARSTGVMLIMASQSLPAIQQQIGQMAAKTLLNNLRTQICMRLEDHETLEHFVTMTGKTYRGMVIEDDFYETQGQREIEMPDRQVPALDGARISFQPAPPGFGIGGMRPAKLTDLRFILQHHKTGHDQDNTDAVTGSQQAAFWRQEDQEKEMLGRGLDYKPIFEAGDVKMGSRFAIAYVQRAAGHSFDVVDLEIGDLSEPADDQKVDDEDEEIGEAA
ncbi:TraM recognition domain-containing protein [Gluconacetobacter diazotrophicus]|uniref:TraM recognition domain-containing protein n=1 Tax=Gluconacetobacter diazotrophicus TaxID=33996 RepID=A0A7W4FBS2_GLUDI|nr:TraM recognition domain-containing protein [Gluconacetobacter diazotrophicus]MBB2154824.1 TraM recognition domain-containing protein [Gluconacetobacter diazotrophicus]